MWILTQHWLSWIMIIHLSPYNSYKTCRPNYCMARALIFRWITLSCNIPLFQLLSILVLFSTNMQCTLISTKVMVLKTKPCNISLPSNVLSILLFCWALCIGNTFLLDAWVIGQFLHGKIYVNVKVASALTSSYLPISSSNMCDPIVINYNWMHACMWSTQLPY